MDSIIKQRIKDLTEQVENDMKLLEKYILELDNSMNECDCEDKEWFDFRGITPEWEGYILCINCGGYIEPKDIFD